MSATTIKVYVTSGTNGVAEWESVPEGATIRELARRHMPESVIDQIAVLLNQDRTTDLDQILKDSDVVTFAPRQVNAGGDQPLLTRQPGLAKEMVLFMSPDFNTPLEDFKEYME